MPEFKKLGYQTKEFDVGSNHKVLFISFSESKPFITVIGYIDTVFTKNSPFQKYKIRNGKLIGPGSSDMKGGIVLILKTLGKLDLEQRKQLRIILNDDEEIGSPFSGRNLKQLTKKVPYGLIYEPARPNGSVVTSLKN